MCISFFMYNYSHSDGLWIPWVHDCWYTSSFSTDTERQRIRCLLDYVTFVHTHSVNTEPCGAKTMQIHWVSRNCRASCRPSSDCSAFHLSSLHTNFH